MQHMYADYISEAMKIAIDETERRRTIQDQYNQEHGIVPTTVKKKIGEDLRKIYGLIDSSVSGSLGSNKDRYEQALAIIKENKITKTKDIDKLILKKTRLMEKQAGLLNFEIASQLKEEVVVLKDFLLNFASNSDLE